MATLGIRDLVNCGKGPAFISLRDHVFEQGATGALSLRAELEQLEKVNCGEPVPDPCPTSGPNGSPPRAVWVWWSHSEDKTKWNVPPADTATFWTKNILANPSAYLTFAKAQGIVRTWLALRTSMIPQADVTIVAGNAASGAFTKQLQAFCEMAKAQCMEVELLFGNDENMEPQGYVDRAKFCLGVIAEMTKNFPGKPGIAGIQADIEYHLREYPAGHPDAGEKIWEALSDDVKKMAQFTNFQQSQQDAKALRDKLLQTASDLVTLGSAASVPVSMAAWWAFAKTDGWPGHSIGGIALSRKLLDVGIHIALMDYRPQFDVPGSDPNEDSAVRWAYEWLDHAVEAAAENAKVGKVWLGLETKCSFPEVSYCGTLAQQAAGDLTKTKLLNPDLTALDKLGNTGDNKARYAGVAVHDGAGYQALVKKLAAG